MTILRSAKEVKHIIINLFCRTFGGSPDALEVWDGANDDYMLMRKEDGWILTIPQNIVDLYLSGDKSSRENGKSLLIEAFHNFRPP